MTKKKIPRGRNGGRHPECAADGAKIKVSSAIPERIYSRLAGIAKTKGKTLSWVICEFLTVSTDQL